MLSSSFIYTRLLPHTSTLFRSDKENLSAIFYSKVFFHWSFLTESRAAEGKRKTFVIMANWFLIFPRLIPLLAHLKKQLSLNGTSDSDSGWTSKHDCAVMDGFEPLMGGEQLREITVLCATPERLIYGEFHNSFNSSFRSGEIVDRLRHKSSLLGKVENFCRKNWVCSIKIGCATGALEVLISFVNIQSFRRILKLSLFSSVLNIFRNFLPVKGHRSKTSKNSDRRCRFTLGFSNSWPIPPGFCKY